ncbi:MAG: dTDP-4-dehydrorhamnose reductase [Cyanobacteria bacterium]|nr:dTDP-4-dehydrorhamnose reductase [Cyanobacteriota bacterium]
MLEIWGGPECTLNRVGGEFSDQIVRSGHEIRLDDLQRFASLGLTALRYPVLWERVAPWSLECPDWSWSDERLDRMSALGIRPIAGLLHHGSGPAYTSLLDPDFPELLARYARMVAERYPWVTDYTPVNEPLTTARFSALYGLWYPHRRSKRDFVRALLNQIRGVALAMQAIREVNPAARLIQTEDGGRCYGTWVTRRQVAFENHRRWLTFDLLSGRVTSGHPLWKFLIAGGATRAELESLGDAPTPPDVVGLNYYMTSDRMLDHRLDRYPASLHGGNGRIRYADAEAVRMRADGINGHRSLLLEAWRRYRLPVALTEVHLACTREEQLRWLHEAWQGARDAAADGANVVAITPWALLGSYDWDTLVTKRQDHYEPGAYDVRAPAPRPTALVPMIRKLARGERPGHPALAKPGWWRRPERLIYDQISRRDGVTNDARPVLILGATGTLGRALVRIAGERGLAVARPSRAEADITNPDAIRAVIDRVNPWAVINATGYVRVDDAEQDSEACYGINTVGAANVAAACRQRGVRLISYSSDLVFGGDRDQPYTEKDSPRPLNVYGASKAEGERRVLDLMPEALVVRTSAFFGPWDTSNFVVQTLDAIRQGRRWRAAADVVVSPTYVPDLANAALDLLFDGESGIWHLSNEGPISWFEFARSAAAACGEPGDLIEPASAAALGWPAPRPSYSALSSVRGRVMRSTADALSAFAATSFARQ